MEPKLSKERFLKFNMEPGPVPGFLFCKWLGAMKFAGKFNSSQNEINKATPEFFRTCSR